MALHLQVVDHPLMCHQGILQQLYHRSGLEEEMPLFLQELLQTYHHLHLLKYKCRHPLRDHTIYQALRQILVHLSTCSLHQHIHHVIELIGLPVEVLWVLHHLHIKFMVPQVQEIAQRVVLDI